MAGGICPGCSFRFLAVDIAVYTHHNGVVLGHHAVKIPVRSKAFRKTQPFGQVSAHQVLCAVQFYQCPRSRRNSLLKRAAFLPEHIFTFESGPCNGIGLRSHRDPANGIFAGGEVIPCGDVSMIHNSVIIDIRVLVGSLLSYHYPLHADSAVGGVIITNKSYIRQWSTGLERGLTVNIGSAAPGSSLEHL